MFKCDFWANLQYQNDFWNWVGCLTKKLQSQLLSYANFMARRSFWWKINQNIWHIELRCCLSNISISNEYWHIDRMFCEKLKGEFVLDWIFSQCRLTVEFKQMFWILDICTKSLWLRNNVINILNIGACDVLTIKFQKAKLIFGIEYYVLQIHLLS